MAITLSADATRRLQASIKRFAAEHLDEEIGDLKATLVLDFFLREIGPSVYNHAIADAQKYFQERALDLEGVCYQKEFGYWPTGGRP
jgi:uncharacterized protein (DUF2164 family)